MQEIKFISFTPQNGRYQISYPSDYLIEEADDGIVSITCPQNAITLTLSSYTNNNITSEESVSKFFNIMTSDYEPISDIIKATNNDQLILEGKFYEDSIWWVWWAISKSNRIIAASLNSSSELTLDEYHLFKNIITSLELNID